MGARLKKQLTIVGVILAVVFIGIGVYRATHRPPEPTCFDKIKNQSEVDVDCGGVCAPCATKPQNITVEKTEFVISEQLRSDVVATFMNPNNNFGLQEQAFTIELVGENNEIVGTRNSSMFLLPREKKEIVEHAIETRGRKVNTVRVTLGEATWVEISRRDPLRDDLVITDQVFERFLKGPEFARAKGIVRNDSHYTYRTLLITVILRDEQDTLRAARASVMNDVRPGEKREFVVAWRLPLPESMVLPEMDVATNLFLEENFLEVNGSFEPFRSFEQ